MYESSGSQFFRTTTGIQSGPDTFDESRFVMTFLTILAVEEICSFRLVVEGKTERDTQVIKIRVLRKVFSKQFSKSRPLNIVGIADLANSQFHKIRAQIEAWEQ